MRKLVSIGLAVIAGLALAAVAFAQSTPDNPAPAKVTVTAKVKPTKGGSLKKPKNASTKIRFDVNKESFSTLAGIKYSIPKSIKISGAGFPTCSIATVTDQGESACPKKSRVGTGKSTALLGPGQAPLQFNTGVYVSGKKSLTLALQQVNGPVQVAFAGKITKKAITLSIPDNVQQPVPNTFSYVTSTTAILGPAKIKKGGKTYFLVSRVGCFGGKDKETVTLPLSANPKEPAKNPIKGSASGKCTK